MNTNQIGTGSEVASNLSDRSYERVRNFHTPWGNADSRTHYGSGVVFYGTPSHGGFKLSNERLEALHAKFGPVKTFCGWPSWFEEDCDWRYVAMTFPELFTADELATAESIHTYLAAKAA